METELQSKYSPIFFLQFLIHCMLAINRHLAMPAMEHLNNKYNNP